ncbi:TPA: hypothetical protein QDB45_005941 [Burkholderia vietnamiensis]|jgi:hypothetical protein|nr:hypothetical protein [Burkholderia vietnamiensis]
MKPKKIDPNRVMTFATNDPFRRSSPGQASPAKSASAAPVTAEAIDRSKYPFAPSLEQLRAARARPVPANLDLTAPRKRMEEWNRTGYQPKASSKEDDDQMIENVRAMLAAHK